MFFTIGHSNRTLDGFLSLLHSAQIVRLADVRRIPRSGTNPQFNIDTLPDAIAPSIGYLHIAELGGRRSRRKDVSPATNAFWKNQSFHNYADYAMGSEFAAGFSQLLELGRDGHCAIMCAETLWWRCHRRIITDYLIARGETVVHIIDADEIGAATLTPGACPQPDGTVAYPDGDSPSARTKTRSGGANSD
ncbi:DUF488 family protein [Paraburkholderia rhizosphaerae]|uniref:Uncharacterized protein DUF488 n=1 Tax=Paraburkholderia rhizosphaerae TaxID=480658 RepID=A0A4R8LLW7_9BURK|nr:DUF488 domain-containing protein [Paraburkholderia rhizosphaerae]TDY43858.1 uncharacterized protein DUF488 [Paraburkholderia rhizosphaerae]